MEYSVSESIVAHLQSCNYFEAEVFNFENTTEVSLMFLQLLDEWRERHSFNQAKSTIYSILDKIDSDKKTLAEKTAFADCLKYIETHFCESSLDIGTMCKMGFISQSTLQREFLQHFGMSPKRYIIKLRMERALALLAENGLSIKEVAFACGFTDEKYFQEHLRINTDIRPHSYEITL